MAANDTATTNAVHTVHTVPGRAVAAAAGDGDAGAIVYRPVVWEDVEAITDAFCRTWGAGESDDPDIARRICHHFVLHYLEPATGGDVAESEDGVFLGVTLARVEGEPVLFPHAGEELARVNAALDATEAGAATLARTNLWHEVEERMEDDIDLNATVHAELELFLVAEQARGKGVGGTLWRRVLGYFAEHGQSRYYLHTDSSCDVGFYEHKGLDLVAERYAADSPDTHVGSGEDIFIYVGETPAAASAAAQTGAADAESGEARA